MNELFNRIYNMLLNFHNQDTEIKQAISWIEKELENPTRTEGYSLDEKVSILIESKEELEKNLKDYSIFREEETFKIKNKVDLEFPDLWNLAKAKLMTDLIINNKI